MTSLTIRAAAAALALSVIGGVAHASTMVVQAYQAKSAYNDSYGKYGSGHSAYLPSVHGGSDYDFVKPGRFSVYDDGTARLTGRIVSDSLGSDYAFKVDVLFKAQASATPKRELKAAAYAKKGGPVDTSTWSFFNMISGQLTGLGKFAGTTRYLFEAPVSGKHPFQVGYGANGKNVAFGGSGWFFHTDNARVDCSANPNSCRMGDFNVDLIPAPVPAAGLLFPVALGAIGFVTRRRRKDTV